MRLVIWFLLLFGAATVVALTLGANQGVVSVYWPGWRLDVSLNLFLITTVLGVAAFYSLLRSFAGLADLPRRARRWRISQRDLSAQAALREALAQLIAGRYTRAHRAAQRAVNIQKNTPELVPDVEFNALAHLLCASSLHRLQDRAQRDQQLELALQQARLTRAPRPSLEGAQLLAAQWALDDRDAPRALRHLAELSPGVARRTLALRLRLRAAQLADQPLDALKTSRLLAKHQGLEPSVALGLARSLAAQALARAKDVDQLKQIWQQIDPADRRDARICAAAATQLSSLGAPELARQWLQPFWERIGEYGADERAALSAALVHSTQGLLSDWLPRLEAAAQQFPRDASVQHALGQALMQCQLWGKARRYLEAAAQTPSLEPTARKAAWLALARLAEQEQRAEDASRCYRQAALAD